MTRLLIVDEDESVRQTFIKSLRQHGHYVIALDSSDQLAAQLAIVRPDFLVLDLTTQFGIDRLLLCEEIRAWNDIPILLTSVSANHPTQGRVFRAGADGLLVKPYSVHEVLEAIEHIEQRRHLRTASPLVIIKTGHLTIDLKAQVVNLRGEQIELTPKEYELLSTLAAAEGNAVSHQLLTTSLWGHADFRTRTHLHALVRRLRKKLGDDSLHATYIVCEPRVGYRLCISSASTPKPA